MKFRITIIGVMAGLLIAGSAMAGDRGPRMDRNQQRGGQDIGLQVMEHLGKAMRRLDLSEDQKVAIKEEFGGFREIIRPLVKELHSGKMELRDVISAGAFDADAAAEIAEQQGQLTADITLLVSEAVAGVMSHLDEEQRAELQAMGEERKARRQERRGKVKARMKDRRETRQAESAEGN